MNNDLSVKVGMLILMQSDLQAGVEFYKKIGFQLKFNIKDQWAEFLIGSVKLALCPTSMEPFDRHTGIVLEVNDLNKFHAKLKEENVEIFKEPVMAAHGIMASIKDPAGNIMDLYEPTPENLKEFVKNVTKPTE